MPARPLLKLVLPLSAALSLTACAGYYGDGGYGYGGVSVGIGTGYGGGYYDPYYDDFYDPRWGSPYWGWYDNFYYPGTGYYIYDRFRRPYRWNDHYRRYWLDRRYRWRGDRRHMSDQWNDFSRQRSRQENLENYRRFREERQRQRGGFGAGAAVRQGEGAGRVMRQQERAQPQGERAREQRQNYRAFREQLRERRARESARGGRPAQDD